MGNVVRVVEVPGLEELAEDFLFACEAKGLSPATTDYYRREMDRQFLPWCRREGIGDLAELDRRSLDGYVRELMERGISKHTVNSYVRPVRVFLNWCKDGGYMVPAQPSLVRAPQSVVDVLSRQEIESLARAATSVRDELVVRLLGDTGIRLSEMLQLTLEDVQVKERRLLIHGKGARERYVGIASEGLMRALRRYLQARPEATTRRLLLSSRRSARGEYEPLTKAGVTKLLMLLGRRAGLKQRVHPHLFRHSFATEMLRKTHDPLVTRRVLGHSSLAMLDRHYAHLAETDNLEAMRRTLSGDE